MTTPLDPPATEASVTRRPFGWLFNRRVLRPMVFGVVLVATAVGLFYAVENWRGRRAWEAYRRDAEARGVVVDFARLIPPRVPDEENFAMTPFLRPLLDFKPGTQEWRDKAAYERVINFESRFLSKLPAEARERLRAVVPEERRKQMNGDWRQGQRCDPAAIYLLHTLDTNQTARSAPGFDPAAIDAQAGAVGIIENMGLFEPVFAELREAAKRPYSRFNIHYEEENLAGILLPHLAKLKNLTQLLSYRASAELVLGRTDEALADVLLAMRLARSLETERTLISYLVRVAIVKLAMQPVWEGMADRRWTGAQMEALREAFAREDPVAGMQYALEGERGFGNGVIEYLRRKPEAWEMLLGPEFSSDLSDGSVLRSLMPSGWFHLEQVEYNRLFDQMLRNTPATADQPFDPGASREGWADLEKSLEPSSAFWRHQFLARLLLPALAKVQQRAADLNAALVQLQAGLALEQYYLANKAYPERLFALVPSFLPKVPKDVIQGGPLNYRRTADGRYLLYSIGWNGVDDGGKRADEAGGDWVWSYSPD